MALASNLFNQAQAPTYSVAERDRRWALGRQLMDASRSMLYWCTAIVKGLVRPRSRPTPTSPMTARAPHLPSVRGANGALQHP
jgi:hypothetical protein